MSNEASDLQFALNIFEIEQTFADENEINLPTRYGVLLRPNQHPLVVTTAPRKFSVLNYSSPGITSLRTNNVRFCGVISASNNDYKLLTHAPTPRELNIITSYLLSQVPDKKQMKAKLYLNPEECKRKFPSFLNGENTYKKIYDQLCQQNHLIAKGVTEVTNDSQIICQ